MTLRLPVIDPGYIDSSDQSEHTCLKYEVLVVRSRVAMCDDGNLMFSSPRAVEIERELGEGDG